MSHPSPRRHASRWFSALLIAAALGVLYGRYLRRPHEFFTGDLVSFYQPMRHYVAGCLAEGRLPRWTPAIFAGTPQLADAQLATFYPPTWLHLALPFPLSELVLLLLHLFLGGLGVLFVARRMGLGGAPGLFAALGYALSGFFASHMVHPNFVHSAAWVPWLMGLLHAVVAGGVRHRGAAVAGAAMVTALALLAGGVQIAYLGLGLAALLTAGWVLATPGLDHRTRFLRGAAAAGAVLLGVLLAAVQLWPTAELAPLSIRAEGVTLELARSYRVAARQGLGLVVPFPFGLAERTPVVWSQPFHESFGYFGVAALPLALTAIFGAGLRAGPTPGDAPWRRALPRLLLAALTCLALLSAMGPDAPLDVHRWLFQWVPGFDRFRAPGRLLYLVLTGTLLLAAMGLQDLLGGDEETRARARRLLLGFTGLSLGAALAVCLLASGAPGPMPADTAALSRRSALGAAGVVLASWILVVGGARWRVAPARVGAGVVAIHLLDLLTVGRALVAARQVPAGADVARLSHRPPAEIRADPRRAHHDHRILFRPDSYFMLQNAGLLHGYDNLRSYSPVMLRRTYDLIHLADRGRFPSWDRLPVDHNLIAVRGHASPVLRLLGVRHVLGHDRPRAAPGRRADLRWRVLTLPDALPRAFLVSRTRLAPRREDRERLLGSIDLGNEALVETPEAMIAEAVVPEDDVDTGGGPGRDTGRGPGRGAPGGIGRAQVTFRDRCAGDAWIRVEATAPGLLVFTEAWHPGWRATVDGRPAAVHRVNHGLLGVRISGPGSPDVQLRFRPRSLLVGAWVSGLAGLVVLALLLVPWWVGGRQRRTRV